MNNSVAVNGNPSTLSALTKDINMNTRHPHAPVPTATIQHALTLIDHANLADLLDDPNAATERAVPTLDLRTVLAAWIILALNGETPTTENISNLLAARLTPKARELLALHESFATHTQTQIARSVRRQTANLLNKIDAFPVPDRSCRLTKSEWDQVDARRADQAPELEDKRIRFLTFANSLLHAQFATLPAETRDGKFNATIDSRFRPAYAAGLPARRMATLAPHDRVSAEPDAGMYVTAVSSRTGVSRAQYGWEDELVVLHPTAPGSAPRIVIGFNPHRPGANPARHAAEALQHLARRGLTLGHVVVDRAYMAARPDGLRAALDDLGAKVIGDYPSHHLGVQDVAGDAILVEGTWYNASMPEHLQRAMLDARRGPNRTGDTANTSIDALITARAPYALRLKTRTSTHPDTNRLEQAAPYRSPAWTSALTAGRNTMESYMAALRHTTAPREGRPCLRGATGHAFLSLLDIIATNARIINEFTTRADSRPR